MSSGKRQIGFALLGLAVLAAAGIVIAVTSKDDRGGRSGGGGGLVARPAPTDPSVVSAPAPGGSRPVVSAAPALAAPAPAAAGSVRPVQTPGGLVFAVGKTSTWVSASAICYQALQGSGASSAFSAMDMIKAKYPELAPALDAADIDISKDLVEVGGYDCGGEPCMYVALELRKPEKLGDALAHISPSDGDAKVKEIDPLLHEVTFSTDTGTRKLMVRAAPIDWSAIGTLPDDPWVTSARKATHVVFLSFANEPATPADALAMLATPAEAAARVAEVEKMVPDPRGRCVAGLVASTTDLPGGFKLVGTRMLLTAPPRSSDDVAAAAMDFSRSVAIEVAMDLDHAPSDEVATSWIEMGKQFAQQAVGSQLGMLEAAVGPGMGAVMGDLLAAAFDHRVEGSSLRLSLSTRNVSSSELAQIEQNAGGAAAFGGLGGLGGAGGGGAGFGYPQ